MRGMVVPVVNLRNRSQPTNGQKSVIVLAELNQLQIGLIVDKVTKLVRIPDPTIP